MNVCHFGDCREVLPRLVAEGLRVQTVVTSPPYWGLRDYGTGEWSGGDPACEHVVGEMRRGVNLAQSVHNTRGGAKKCAEVADIKARSECPHCGAVRVDRQLGLERTPGEYLENMVGIFNLVRELLADDGTLWLNMGDTQITAGGAGWQGKNGARADRRFTPPNYKENSSIASGLKPKDMAGMPWRLAFALQDAGWWLRQDIIWHKPNPMPESVRDRCTKAHEYLFLLSKAERYYFDADAISEPASENTHARAARANGGYAPPGQDMHEGALGPRSKRTADTPAGWDTGPGAHTKLEGRYSDKGKGRVEQGLRPPERMGGGAGWRAEDLRFERRNKRSVWTIATAPYPEAHFATFPEELVEPCILAGSRPGDLVGDFFFGSGTVGQVAQRLGRRWVGCELKDEYGTLQADRTAQAGMVFE